MSWPSILRHGANPGRRAMISESDRLEAYLRDMMKHRPFETYQPQPDTAERVRLEVQSIPLALPEKPK
jgi:hypothetical protein